MFGNITMALITAAIPLTIALYCKQCLLSLNNENLYILIATYTVLPFMIIIPRELSLDISDLEGDLKNGCRTLPILIGVKKSKQIVTILLMLTIIITFISIILYPYLSFAFIPMDVIIIYYLYKLKIVQKRNEYVIIGKHLWLGMILALIMVTALSF